MKRSWVGIAIAVVVLVTAGSAAFVWYRGQSGTKTITPVPAAAAGGSAANGEISVSGTISATEVTKVGVPIDGQVTAFHAEVGDEVYQGQLLAEVTNTGLGTAQQAAEAELERAGERVSKVEALVASARLEASRAEADYSRVKADLDRAARLWNRQQMLLKEGATPKRVAEKAEADFRTLQQDSANLGEVSRGAESRLASLTADLDNARKTLERRSEDMEATKARVDSGQVFSTVSGLVTGRRGVAGDEVHPTMDDFFQIATDLSRLTVTVEPSPAVVAKIKPGLEVLVVVADLPNEALAGVVRAVENGRVVIDFANPSPVVKPGLTAQVRIRLP